MTKKLVSFDDQAVGSGLPAVVEAELNATYDSRKGRRVNVWDYGVVGDGVVDDSPAIQAAIDAAGVGGYIEVGKGTFGQARFRCNSPLTMLNFQTLDGAAIQVGVGGTATLELIFPSLTAGSTALTMGASCSLRNILLRGPGAASVNATGITNTNATARFHQVSVIAWRTGIALSNAYYSQFYECEFSRNSVGLALTNCYNVNLFAPRFYCGIADGALGLGITTGTVRGLKIFGGSIEGFGGGGIMITGANGDISLYGVYFESPTGTSGSYALDGSGGAGTALTVQGCTVYLTNIGRFVSCGTAGGYVLNGSGNKFYCSAESTTTPIAYVISPGSEVNLAGDSWSNVDLPAASYVGGALNAGAQNQLNVSRPIGAGTDTVAYIGRSMRLPAGATVGMNNKTPPAVVTLPPAATDAATTQALVNALRTVLIGTGYCA